MDDCDELDDRLLELLVVLGVSLIWGGGFFFTRLLSESLDEPAPLRPPEVRDPLEIGVVVAIFVGFKPTNV